MRVPRCACRCGCRDEADPDCDRLCEECWRQWCTASEKHAPIADNSYMGAYGLANIWTGWVISQAPHVVAEPPSYLQQRETAPECPECPNRMIRRPGEWKCYHHDPPVVVPVKIDLPRSPRLAVI